MDEWCAMHTPTLTARSPIDITRRLNPIPHCIPGTIRLSSAQRLVNGTNAYSGRLEVLRGGAWAPVAVYDATRRASVASKACTLLGFISASSPVLESPGAFGPPSTSAGWLNMSYCSGLEPAYTECTCGYFSYYYGYDYRGSCYYYGTCGYTYYQETPCRDSAVTLQTGNETALAAKQVAVTCPAPGAQCLPDG